MPCRRILSGEAKIPSFATAKCCRPNAPSHRLDDAQPFMKELELNRHWRYPRVWTVVEVRKTESIASSLAMSLTLARSRFQPDINIPHIFLC